MAKATTKKSSSATATTTKTTVRRVTVGKQLVLGALVAEMLGSAVLAFAALLSGNNPILAAVALIVGTLIFSEISGGYLNPIVTAAAWATRQITWVKALGYIVVQVLGAMLAYVIVAKFMKDSSVYTLFTAADDPSVAQGLAQAREPGEWKPIFGELVGSIIFGFGIASIFLSRNKLGFERAFTLGGALLVGLIAALAGSYAVVNPAVAVALGGFAQGGFWSIAAYGLIPLVGGIVGAWLFKLLKQDTDTSVAEVK